MTPRPQLPRTRMLGTVLLVLFGAAVFSIYRLPSYVSNDSLLYQIFAQPQHQPNNKEVIEPVVAELFADVEPDAEWALVASRPQDDLSIEDTLSESDSDYYVEARILLDTINGLPRAAASVKVEDTRPEYIMDGPDDYDLLADFQERSAADAEAFRLIDSFDARTYATYWSHTLFQWHPMVLQQETDFIYQIYQTGHSKKQEALVNARLLEGPRQQYFTQLSTLCGTNTCLAVWDVTAGPEVDASHEAGYRLKVCDEFFTDASRCEQQHLVDYHMSAQEFALNHAICSDSFWTVSAPIQSYPDCMRMFFKPRMMLSIRFDEPEEIDARLSLRNTVHDFKQWDVTFTTVTAQSYADHELQPLLEQFKLKYHREAKINSSDCDQYCVYQITDAMPVYPNIPVHHLDAILADPSHPLAFSYTFCEPVGHHSPSAQLEWHTLNLLCKPILSGGGGGDLYSFDPNGFRGVDTY